MIYKNTNLNILATLAKTPQSISSITKRRLSSISMSKQRIKVLFAGRGHFESGYIYTKQCINEKFSEDEVYVTSCERKDLLHELQDTTVLVPLMSRISIHELNHAPMLKHIVQFGVGLEGVDINAATNAKVWVSKINSDYCGNAASCAEHALYLAIAVLRNQYEMNYSIYLSRLGVPTGKTILNSNIMIYGYGNIGKQLLQRLVMFQPNSITIIQRNEKNCKTVIHQNYMSFTSDSIFNMPTINADTTISTTTTTTTSSSSLIVNTKLSQVNTKNSHQNSCYNNYNKSLNDDNPSISDDDDSHTCTLRYVLPQDYEQYASNTDICFICCNQNNENLGMVNKDFISKLKPGAIIVNIARGGLLNYDDTLNALNSGHLYGVGTDVYKIEPFPLNDIFLNHPKVVATPHIGGVTEISYRNMAKIVTNHVDRIYKNLHPIDTVNFIE